MVRVNLTWVRELLARPLRRDEIVNLLTVAGVPVDPGTVEELLRRRTRRPELRAFVRGFKTGQAHGHTDPGAGPGR